MEEKFRMKIKADKEDLTYLMKIFKVSNVTVWEALNYRKGDRELHRKIRKAAIEHGCKVVMEIMDMECFYFTEENGERCMVQKFPNGASLTGSFATGGFKLTDRNRVLVREWENVMISEIPAMQQIAICL